MFDSNGLINLAILVHHICNRWLGLFGVQLSSLILPIATYASLLVWVAIAVYMRSASW